MRRGTTPTHIFTTDTDLTNAVVIYLSYEQYGEIVLEKTKEDMTVDSKQVKVTLTQEETLAFGDRGDVEMQIRARFPDDTAIASNIITADVERILKGGEI